MKISKVTCVVRVEVLSKDVIPSLLIEVSQKMQPECVGGHLRKDDGDEISWEVVTHQEKEV